MGPLLPQCVVLNWGVSASMNRGTKLLNYQYEVTICVKRFKEDLSFKAGSLFIHCYSL